MNTIMMQIKKGLKMIMQMLKTRYYTDNPFYSLSYLFIVH